MYNEVFSMKKVITLITLLLLIFLTFKHNVVFSIDYLDDIRNSDEYLIKKFRSHHNYSLKELRQLEIDGMFEIDGYKIYYVSIKDSQISDGWVQEEYNFPSESYVRIVGIKNGRLYILEKLVEENLVFTKGLYKLIQEYSARRL
jgi:hypothetical protein